VDRARHALPRDPAAEAQRGAGRQGREGPAERGGAGKLEANDGAELQTARDSSHEHSIGLSKATGTGKTTGTGDHRKTAGSCETTGHREATGSPEAREATGSPEAREATGSPEATGDREAAEVGHEARHTRLPAVSERARADYGAEVHGASVVPETVMSVSAFTCAAVER
jgi:hypothetical protein